MQRQLIFEPCLPTSGTKVPDGNDWLHEIKYDGYRVQIHLSKGKKKIFTRNGLDWTKRFSVIAGALDLPGQAIIDGEVVVIKDGRTNFSELQAELAAGRQDKLVFYAFDLLYLNGLDLRRVRQIERQARAIFSKGSKRQFSIPSTWSATVRRCSSTRPS
jgi:bifunctional non-homologous end joining protein LigD